MSEEGVFSQKFKHRQSGLHHFGSNLIYVQTVIQNALKWPKWNSQHPATSWIEFFCFPGHVLLLYPHFHLFCLLVDILRIQHLQRDTTLLWPRKTSKNFPLSALQRPLSTIQKFLWHSPLHMMRTHYSLKPVTFRYTKIANGTTHLTRHYSTITHATILVQEWNDSADCILSTLNSSYVLAAVQSLS